MWRKLRIGARLFSGFGVVLTLLFAIAVLGLRSMGAIAENMDLIANRYGVQERYLNQMNEQIHIAQRIMRTITLLTVQGQSAQAQREKLATTLSAYNEAAGKLQTTLVSEEAKRQFGRIRDSAERTREANDRTLQLVAEKKTAEAIALLLGEGLKENSLTLEILGEMNAYLEKSSAEKYQAAKSEYHSAQVLMITMSVLALLAGGVLSLLITRSITRPIQDFRGLLGSIADGDLRDSADVRGRDELGDMGRSLNDALGRLKVAFAGIQESSRDVAQASREIASGNQEISYQTEQQAASLQETASGLEEFTANAAQIAENASQASEASSQARWVAEEGSMAVQALVASMEEINASSTRINEIIGVVDEIAFQTNLLALNAAVEAARAGEQGRGFAVVATEVRSLAKRSADAAKEIKGLIRESVNKAQQGQMIAAQTGTIIEGVVKNVQNMASLITDIAAAAREQSDGIGEINRAISQMDNVTQQNAAQVEQAAASAESLDEQAHSLAAIASEWETGVPSSPAAAPPTSRIQSHQTPRSLRGKPLQYLKGPR